MPHQPAFDKRCLFVHAHPDDESLGTGATIARYVAEGRGVTVVTCTAGEMGEVLVPELEYLADDKEGGLGEHRRGELADAMRALGVTDHRWLGGFGKYRDSGMKWHEDGYAIPADPPEDGQSHENAFWHADLLAAATDLVQILREVRPQVLVMYNDFGGYGHPDHIQSHRVATYAAALAAVPSFRRDLGEAWVVAKTYWGALSASRMRAAIARMREAGDAESFRGLDPDSPMPWATEDADLSAVVDGSAYAEQKLAALKAYPTQVAPDNMFFRAAEHTEWAQEFYRLAAGTPGPLGPEGLEADLFAGL